MKNASCNLCCAIHTCVCAVTYTVWEINTRCSAVICVSEWRYRESPVVWIFQNKCQTNGVYFIYVHYKQTLGSVCERSIKNLSKCHPTQNQGCTVVGGITTMGHGSQLYSVTRRWQRKLWNRKGAHRKREGQSRKLQCRDMPADWIDVLLNRVGTLLTRVCPDSSGWWACLTGSDWRERVGQEEVFQSSAKGLVFPRSSTASLVVWQWRRSLWRFSKWWMCVWVSVWNPTDIFDRLFRLSQKTFR